MRIEILIIIFLVSFGIAFMNFKNKQKSKEIRKKMEKRITDYKENSKE